MANLNINAITEEYVTKQVEIAEAVDAARRIGNITEIDSSQVSFVDLVTLFRPQQNNVKARRLLPIFMEMMGGETKAQRDNANNGILDDEVQVKMTFEDEVSVRQARPNLGTDMIIIKVDEDSPENSIVFRLTADEANELVKMEGSFSHRNGNKNDGSFDIRFAKDTFMEEFLNGCVDHELTEKLTKF